MLFVPAESPSTVFPQKERRRVRLSPTELEQVDTDAGDLQCVGDSSDAVSISPPPVSDLVEGPPSE